MSPPGTEVEYLDLEDLLALTRALHAGPVRDLGLLDSACARPRSTAFGTDAYPTLEGKDAALLHPLARDHALIDGHERLAWLACVVFLDLDGCTVEMDDDAAFPLVMEVASATLDVEGIVERSTAS